MKFVQKYLLQIWIAKENLLQWKNTAREIAAIDVLAKVTFWKYCFSLILNCLDAEKNDCDKTLIETPIENFTEKFLTKNFTLNFKTSKKGGQKISCQNFPTIIFKPKFSIQKFFRTLENLSVFGKLTVSETTYKIMNQVCTNVYINCRSLWHLRSIMISSS